MNFLIDTDIASAYLRGSSLVQTGKDKEFCVSRHDQLLAKILWGASDNNIPFKGLCSLLRHLGFAERIRGSHHIFTKDGVREILNLQPKGPRRIRSNRFAV
jgi:hypothetical protein